MTKTRMMALLGVGTAALVAGATVGAAQDAYQIPQITVYTETGEAITTTGQISLKPDVVKKMAVTQPSTAEVLQNVAPGLQIQQAGPVSQLPVLRGFNDDRLRQTINGNDITSACANHMNPPLSYIDPRTISSVKVSLPVSGVSSGGDAIGGGIAIVTNKPKFTSDDPGVIPGKIDAPPSAWSGNVHAGYRFNGHVVSAGAHAEIHGETASLSYSGDWAKGSDFKDGHGDKVLSNHFETQNHEVTLGLKSDLGVTTLKARGQYMPEQEYMNQRMDMNYNKSFGISAAQEKDTDWGLVNALAYYNYVRHNMNYLQDKKYLNNPAGRDMPMDTEGQDFGYKLSLTHSMDDGSTLKIGNELHRQLLDEWWPPVVGKPGMCCDTYQLINNGERTRLGTFIEWDKKLSEQWSALVGVRNDIVWMNTGDVQGYNVNPAMGYGADAAAFNAKDHDKTDVNFDATAMLTYKPSDNFTLNGGYARKTRSPNFYERYVWSTANTMPGQMSKNMIGWFGDGNGYMGNLDVDPEVAHNFSITATLKDAADDAWSLSVSPFYSYVDDYIGVRFVNDSTAAPAGSFSNLQFVNHDAEMYGFDAWGRVRLAKESPVGELALSGSLSVVRGKNKDTGGNLYHMMPFNGRVALEQKGDIWSNTLSLQFVTAKTKVDADRKELTTEAYALLNWQSTWNYERFHVTAGVDNILDSYYETPLGGHEIAPTFLGEAKDNVPGPGRTIYAGFAVDF